MAEVVDRQGDTWHPELNLGTVREIERRCDVTLLRRPDTPEDAPGPRALTDDLNKLLMAIAICCADEVKERGLTVEALAKRFERGPLFALIGAFNEEFAAFTGLDLEAIEREGGGSADQVPLAGTTYGVSALKQGSAIPGDSGSGSSNGLPNTPAASPGDG